jgi:hypothetical protein
MANTSYAEKYSFDTQLSLAAPFTGAAQLVGTLTNNPVMILFKNQSTVSVFLADNSGSTKGTTMAVGEEIILDLATNRELATKRSWPIGTSFYVTGTGGTGDFKISVIIATS